MISTAPVPTGETAVIVVTAVADAVPDVPAAVAFFSQGYEQAQNGK